MRTLGGRPAGRPPSVASISVVALDGARSEGASQAGVTVVERDAGVDLIRIGAAVLVELGSQRGEGEVGSDPVGCGHWRAGDDRHMIADAVVFAAAAVVRPELGSEAGAA